MYEWIKKIFSNIRNIIFSVVLLVLLLWAVITNVRLYSTQKSLRRTESELGLIRTELSNAQNRECELTETVGNIREITERTDALLDQSGDTIQSIRKEVQVLENYFRNVDMYIHSNSDDTDS